MALKNLLMPDTGTQQSDTVNIILADSLHGKQPTYWLQVCEQLLVLRRFLCTSITVVSSMLKCKRSKVLCYGQHRCLALLLVKSICVDNNNDD